MAFRWYQKAMYEKKGAAEKSIVGQLNFGKLTAKRVSWESWEFTIEAPYLVRVTNAAYGYLKDDHSYLVGVEDRDGVVVPAECECKADLFSERYDCKHKVALAAIGGGTVLEAAVNFPTATREIDAAEVTTGADKLRADGGPGIPNVKNPAPRDTESASSCDCESLGGFPCWPCVRDGKRDLSIG